MELAGSVDILVFGSQCFAIRLLARKPVILSGASRMPFLSRKSCFCDFRSGRAVEAWFSIARCSSDESLFDFTHGKDVNRAEWADFQRDAGLCLAKTRSVPKTGYLPIPPLPTGAFPFGQRRWHAPREPVIPPRAPREILPGTAGGPSEPASIPASERLRPCSNSRCSCLNGLGRENVRFFSAQRARR